MVNINSGEMWHHTIDVLYKTLGAKYTATQKFLIKKLIGIVIGRLKS